MSGHQHVDPVELEEFPGDRQLLLEGPYLFAVRQQQFRVRVVEEAEDPVGLVDVHHHREGHARVPHRRHTQPEGLAVNTFHGEVDGTHERERVGAVLAAAVRDQHRVAAEVLLERQGLVQPFGAFIDRRNVLGRQSFEKFLEQQRVH